MFRIFAILSATALGIPAARVDLLLQCCSDESKLKSVVFYLEEMSSQPSSCIYRHLLLRVYTQKPSGWCCHPSDCVVGNCDVNCHLFALKSSFIGWATQTSSTRI